MKYLIITFSFLLFNSIGLAFDEIKSTKINLRSSEEIIFYAKKDLPFFDMGKISELSGLLTRQNEIEYELRTADLYQFPKEENLKMSFELCNQYADKMFGYSHSKTLTLNDSLNLFATPVGKTCEFQLTDTSSKVQFQYRYVQIGFIHGRLLSLVWTLSHAPAEDTKKSLQRFWMQLK